MSKKRGKTKVRQPRSTRGHKSWCAARHSKSPCTCGAETERRR